MTDAGYEGPQGVHLGTAEIVCPECDAVLPVPVRMHLGAAENGQQMLVTDPDMTDLWAHAFTHEDTRWVENEYDHD